MPVSLEVLVLVEHRQPAGDPADVGLGEGDAQPWEPFQHAAEDHLGQRESASTTWLQNQNIGHER